jgi:hypothetical protein
VAKTLGENSSDYTQNYNYKIKPVPVISEKSFTKSDHLENNFCRKHAQEGVISNLNT